MEKQKQRKDYRKKLNILLDAEMLDNTKFAPKNISLIEKRIGNVLDDILFAMEEKKMCVPAELMELKQWLRGKGNSFRENGDFRYWKDIKLNLKEAPSIPPNPKGIGYP